MIKVQSYLFNPILSPNPKNNWENMAVFNGSVVAIGNKYFMVYRSLGNNLSTIGLAESTDGCNFNHRQQILKPEFPWEQYGLEDPRITKIDDKYYIFYTAISDPIPGPNSIKVAVAVTRDFITFEKHLVTPFNAKAMALFPQKINGKLTAILTANTDLPPSKIALAIFDKESDIWSETFWQQWYQKLNSQEIGLRRVTNDQVEIGAVPVETADGWLLIYSHIQNYYAGKRAVFGIEAVLLDKNNPQKIIGRTTESLMTPQETYELEGMVSNVIFPSGAVIKNDQLFIYYGAADNYCALATVYLLELMTEVKKNDLPPLCLQRYHYNPIIAPRSGVDWESRATFNPAAILINDDIHLLYRAMSLSNTSVIGYAKSNDGITICQRDLQPVYSPREDFEIKKNDNGFGGCEDPRITRIGDTIYICYTAYDGQSSPKIALTSISVDDFINHHWRFSKPKIISDPKFDNKDCCLFPELINGKYVFLHREGGKGIMVDYVDNLNFENGQYLAGEACFIISQNHWENAKMGVASPPIKTEKGWLLFYHGVSQDDQQYRVGAMLLKLDNPEIVIGRTKYPILEPVMDYEKNGEVNNVVFPCGAVVKNSDIFIYYGAADKVIGVAKGNLKQIVDYLVD